ncbi:MAG: molybdate ABC transporter substrate-binding protein [Burkholderiales bacterium]
MIARFAAGLAAILLALPGAHAQDQDRVLVFAAASLRNALDDAARGYPGKRPVISYAGSSSLAKQVERGAPASIFISADRDWMDYIERRGLLEPGTRHDLLGNRLVLVAPRGSTLKLEIAPGMPLVRALGGGRLALGDPYHVPAGMYARAALESLGVWDSVKSHVAATENVRIALALVARGEAPLGIVYETDAREEPGVRVIGRFDASLHPPIVYPIALLKSAPPAARRFAAYLRGAQARAIFGKHGFTPLH